MSNAATSMSPNDELVREVLDGNQAAFAELVRRYERAAWATAWKTLRDYHATQDAIQEAFTEAYRRLGQLRCPERFGVWLLRITRHEALRIVRRRAKTVALVVPNDIADKKQLTPEAVELFDALGRLPEHERLVIALRYLDDLPVAEVARLTGRPVGTVTKQLSRALNRLRARFRR
jgi:RNA polymerase sigma-70 factor (ECF subfamily)